MTTVVTVTLPSCPSDGVRSTSNALPGTALPALTGSLNEMAIRAPVAAACTTVGAVLSSVNSCSLSFDGVVSASAFPALSSMS